MVEGERQNIPCTWSDSASAATCKRPLGNPSNNNNNNNNNQKGLLPTPELALFRRLYLTLD